MTTLREIILQAVDILYALNPILATIAFLVFFWGLSKFILSSGNEAELSKGRSLMLWGIIALFILVSFRGIISIVSRNTGLSNGTIPTLPESPR